jgi:hypothetical protein
VLAPSNLLPKLKAAVLRSRAAAVSNESPLGRWLMVVSVRLCLRGLSALLKYSYCLRSVGWFVSASLLRALLGIGGPTYNPSFVPTPLRRGAGRRLSGGAAQLPRYTSGIL